MHPTVGSDSLLERVALASGQVPRALVLQSLCMGYARCLGAGLRLGVFEALASGPLDAPGVAAATGCHPIGMATLLSGLNGAGLLVHRAGQFRLSREAKRWFLQGSPGNLRDAGLFLADLWDRWATLEQVVRTGQIVDFHAPGQDPGHWERYLRGLACFARLARGEVAKKAALPADTRRVLDVGGGHGVYAVGMCERNTALQVEILDLPDAAAVGRKVVAELGHADRVRHREGDHRVTPWGEGWDAVLIFNVLHNAAPEQAQAMLRRAWAALRPGGRLLILDSEHRETTGDVTAIAGFNEIFFFLLNGTQAWPEATLRAWMGAAGFQDLRARRLLRAPAVLLSGVRP